MEIKNRITNAIIELVKFICTLANNKINPNTRVKIKTTKDSHFPSSRENITSCVNWHQTYGYNISKKNITWIQQESHICRIDAINHRKTETIIFLNTKINQFVTNLEMQTANA